jgi:hypothetical protein
MFRINPKRSIATLSVIAGALAVAAPASASSTPVQNTMVSSLMDAPSGQARIVEDTRGSIESQYVSTSAEVITTAQERGASAGFKSLSGMDSETEFMDYTDDALLDSVGTTGLKFETEITDYLQRRTASGVDVWGLDRGVFSGDAYDNEMGITTQALIARPNSEIRPRCTEATRCPTQSSRLDPPLRAKQHSSGGTLTPTVRPLGRDA